jgi:hypothetical protein
VYADSIFGVGLLAPLFQAVDVEEGLEESPVFPSLSVEARTGLNFVNIFLLNEPVVLGSTIKKRINTIIVIVVIPALFISEMRFINA